MHTNSKVISGDPQTTPKFVGSEINRSDSHLASGRTWRNAISRKTRGGAGRANHGIPAIGSYHQRQPGSTQEEAENLYPLDIPALLVRIRPNREARVSAIQTRRHCRVVPAVACSLMTQTPGFPLSIEIG
jgi:hypothetical protein